MKSLENKEYKCGMRTEIGMKRSYCFAVNRKNETERKTRRKSAEKDKPTSSRREGQTGVRDEVVQTDSRKVRTGALSSWFIQKEPSDSCAQVLKRGWSTSLLAVCIPDLWEKFLRWTSQHCGSLK